MRLVRWKRAIHSTQYSTRLPGAAVRRLTFEHGRLTGDRPGRLLTSRCQEHLARIDTHRTTPQGAPDVRHPHGPSHSHHLVRDPAADLARAQRFYEAILESPLRAENFAGDDIAIFPARDGGVTGCLVATAHPSPHGTIVYLNVDGRLDRTLERVPAAGGQLATPKTELPNGIGFVAHIIDSEGNRIGLHAKS